MQTNLNCPCVERGLDHRISRDPFQPKLLGVIYKNTRIREWITVISMVWYCCNAFNSLDRGKKIYIVLRCRFSAKWFETRPFMTEH